jgi:predicted SprT family Zn-dependent metalloprotease
MLPSDAQIDEWIEFTLERTCENMYLAELKRKDTLDRYYCRTPNELRHEKMISNIKRRWEWSTRMTAAAGIAYSSGLMKFSLPLFSRDAESGNRDTVIHEVCHIINYARNDNAHHGHKWKHLMRLCGLEPKRCHNIDRTGLKRPTGRQSRHQVACGCASTISMGPVQYKRALAGAVYRCRKCKQNISV